MNSKIKNVLVLAPHTDDGELGAGGTIARFIDEGVNVFYAAFSTAEQSVPEGYEKDVLKTEVKAATSRLGIPAENLFVYGYEVRKLSYVRQDILEDLVKLRRQIDVDLVLMPSVHDIHQDHAVVASEATRAFKTNRLLGYELIWNNLMFNTQFFVSLERSHIERKAEALREYKSQSGRDYMSSEFIHSLARTRGVQIGKQYAEAFEVMRWVMH